MSTVFEEWGMRCPKCGSDSNLNITVQTDVLLTPDGTDADESADGSHEWDDTSACQCTYCGEMGEVKHFKVE